MPGDAEHVSYEVKVSHIFPYISVSIDVCFPISEGLETDGKMTSNKTENNVAKRFLIICL